MHETNSCGSLYLCDKSFIFNFIRADLPQGDGIYMHVAKSYQVQPVTVMT